MAETSNDESVAVLSFGASYESVAERLTALGMRQAATMSWSRGPVPDDADWRGAGFDIRFESDFDTKLKLLRASGNPPPDWTRGFDLMEYSEAQRLILSRTKIDAIAGLKAAQHMASSELLDAVRMRLLDDDDDILGEAATALNRIARQERLSAERSAKFPSGFFSTRKESLQLIRRFSQQDDASADGLAVILKDQIASPDWEVRATAVLAAGRLALTGLRREIADARFPEDAALGLSRHEHRVLLALQAAALERVGGARAHGLPDGVAAVFEGDYERLAPENAAFAFSLLEPLSEPTIPPPAAGIVLTAHGPTCTDGTLLSWVPPEQYWLGHGDKVRGEANPARRVVLASGFYIESEPRAPATWSQAQALADERAVALQRPVAIAREDEWEMAARGADGRRLPWGQNADPALRVDLSPLGMAGMLSGPGEWLAQDHPSSSPHATPRTTPGAGPNPLSVRVACPADSLRGFRLAYRLDAQQ